jgi:hypothetical protein
MMTDKHCPGCEEPLRWWQKKGPPTNNTWHKICWLSWSRGYNKAQKECFGEINECKRIFELIQFFKKKGVPLGDQIYKDIKEVMNKMSK